jgi:hypothetical protein
MACYKSIHHIAYDEKVKGSSGEYIVSWGLNRYLDESGHNDKLDWSCTCPDWTYRKQVQGGYCKHINLVKQLDKRNLWEETEYSKPLFIKEGDELLAFVPDTTIRAIIIDES